MRDRIPTQVVNGAVRMEVLNEAGEHVEYLYLKRADEPVEEGTPYNVNNVLTDETAESIGLMDENPTPNQAFAKLAERLVGLDGARAIIDNLENNTIFPHQGFTESGTFTADKTGRYRITAVGKGGDGALRTSSYTGGAGGGGGVGVVTLELSAGDTVNYTISSGNVTVAGVMTARAGANGSRTIGGTGGTVEVLSSDYSVNAYTGGKGANGYGTDEITSQSDAAKGGSVTYDFAGQLFRDEINDGLSIFMRYGFGGGGRGGYGSNNVPYVGRGSAAGIVFEYLGA